MKKLHAAILTAAFLILGYGTSWATDNVSDPANDIATLQFAGSSNTAVALSSAGQANSPDGLVNVHEHFESPPAISTNAYFRSPGVGTGTLVGQSTTYTTGITQSVYPTVAVYTLWVDYGNSTSTLISTGIIVGVDSHGSIVRETVVVTTTPRVGTVAWAKISSMTFSQLNAVSTNAVVGYFGVGSTATFGLGGFVENAADVYKMKAYGVDFTSYTVDTLRQTIRFNNPTPAPSTFDIWHRNTRSAPPRPR